MQQAMRRPLTRRGWIAGSLAGSLQARQESGSVRFSRRIRVALLGLDGHYGEILDPLPRLPDLDLVAASDPNRQNLARVVKSAGLGSTRLYSDYREMLEREQVDVVAVCNNNGERAEAVLACAERKVNVIAEKPLAIERKDLERVRQAVRRHGIRLSMLLPMRFEPPYLAMKQLVDSGELGEVLQIAAQKSYKAGERPEWMRRHATYGGTIPWIGIHMIDLMRWASGREMTEVVSFQGHIGFPEIGDMENVTGSLFRLDNGGLGTLRMDYLRPETAPTHGDDRLRLAGTQGIAEYQQSTGVTVMTAGRKPEALGKLPAARSVFVDFLESVYGGKPTALPLDDILRVNEIALAARESAERGRIERL